MANFTIEIFSNSLMRPISFKMFIPNDVRVNPFAPEKEKELPHLKTLFVLHGYTGAAETWNLEMLAMKHHFAIVSPSAENGFYLNGLSTGHAYQTLVGEELVNYIRRTFGLAMNKDETYITGLSMGGFGALHTAFAYPETFGKVGAMSSALIVHGIAHMKPGTGNGTANYDYYHECFGDLETVEESDANPEVLVKRLKDEGRTIPEIYMCCGTEDFLIEPNRQLHAFLDSIGVEHIYKESKGVHDNVFWDEYKVKIVEWMFA